MRSQKEQRKETEGNKDRREGWRSMVIEKKEREREERTGGDGKRRDGLFIFSERLLCADRF